MNATTLAGPAPDAAGLLEQLPQVNYLARLLHKRLPELVEIDDLIQAVTLGLLDAFKKFDVSKQVQFKSYAQFRIQGAMVDSLRDLDWGPRELRKQAREIERAQHRLSSRLGAFVIGSDCTASEKRQGYEGKCLD